MNWDRKRVKDNRLLYIDQPSDDAILVELFVFKQGYICRLIMFQPIKCENSDELIAVYIDVWVGLTLILYVILYYTYRVKIWIKLSINDNIEIKNLYHKVINNVKIATLFKRALKYIIYKMVALYIEYRYV